MAIIYSYPKNTDILSTDIIVGTSTRVVNGRRKNITKNFEIGAIATFFNETSAIAITGQNNFFFQNNIAPGRKAGSISFILGGGANTPFNNITALRISKFATSGTNVSDYINTLLEQALIIAQTDNLNSFGIYRCNSITPVDGNPNFLDLELEVLNANGNILEDKFYGFAVYPGFVNPNIDPANYDFEYPLLVDGRTISIEQSTTTTDGYLSSVDWNTFNNKQNAITLTTVGSSGAATLVGNTLNIPQYQSVLTNPITGTGTTSYVPRFTGTTTIGNGSIFDDGTKIGIGTTTLTEKVNIVGKIDIVDNPSYNNVFIGREAGTSNTTGTLNIAIGTRALQDASTQTSNIGIGYQALKVNVGGNGQIAIGSNALAFSTTGNFNTAVGNSAALANTTGSFNTAFGYQAAYSVNVGSQNIAIGYNSLYSAQGSNCNSAVGHQSMANLFGGDSNSGIGWQVLYNITTGFENTAVGRQAGRILTTGSLGVYLGYYTTASSSSAINEIVIGANNTGIGSNTVVLGNSSIVTTALRGNIGIGTTNPTRGKVEIVQTSNTSSGGLAIVNSGVSGSTRLWVDSTGVSNISNGTSPNISILSSGNVGIGTTGPGARLDVRAQGALSTDIAFRVRNSADTANLFDIRGNGNIGINTTTDAGFRLDVNGTARVQGLATILGETQTGSGSTGSLSISQTWNTTGVVNLIDTNITDTASGGTSAIMRLRVNNTTAFSLSKIGAINFGNNAGASAIAPSIPTNGSQILNGQSITIYHTITTAEGYALWIRPNSGSRTVTSGTAGMFRIGETFAPTSGTAVFNTQLITPTINQTGGANGITRGLYIQPTLTAAADFRAIEVSSGGAYINTTSVQASAILQADSTTKGFLPPRMTNAQRLAIASPAVGLMVYCTDALEGLYINKSTGWTFII